MSIDITSEFIALERVTEDRWHQPWSEPVRIARRSTDAPFSVASPFPIPSVIVVTPFGWSQPWSEPVRIAQRTALHEQSAYPPTIVAPPVPIAGAVPIGWEGPPASYLRFQYQAQAFVPIVVPVVPAIVVPVAFGEAPYVRSFQYQALAFTPVVAPPVTPPVIIVTGNGDAVIARQFFQYQAQAFTPVVAPIVTVTVPTTWDGPPLSIYRLQYQSQAFAPTVVPPPIITVGVPVIWDGPPASYQRFQYQAVAFGQPPPPVFYGSWGYPWSEPVRQKPGLRASQQDWQEHKPILPPPVFYGSWGYPWSEPVRFKPGLRAWYHPYEFRAPAIYQFLYTARLYAVETDLDRFIGTLYKWWAPLKCYVDIIEFWPVLPYGRTTIIQKGQQGGVNTAIAEPVGQNPQGIISPPAAMGARVAIIVS
jgi:hypothetical protein